MSPPTPLVSILFLTMNGIRDLPRIWQALAAQETDFAFETVVVDSGSTDGTAEFLRPRVDRWVDVPTREFNHGDTRNLGLSHCRGELVVLMVQDAIPADGSWLRELVAPLRADDQVAGTFARQLPRGDASAITRYYLERWVAAGTEPRQVRIDGGAAFAQLTPTERLLSCAFDNVCSCVRRAVWQRHPFVHTPIAEDLIWGKEVLLAGYALAFAPRAAVIHSHDRDALYELKRTCLVHEQLYRLFELRTIRTPRQLAAAVIWSLRTHLDCVKHEPPPLDRRLREAARGVALAVAWPLGQYLGGRSAECGWPPLGFAKGV